MCVLNQLAVRRHLGYRQEVVKTFLKPLTAAGIMGAAAFGVYHGLYLLLPVSRVVLLIAIGVGAVLYFVVILLIGGVNEQELRAFPKGAMMAHYAKKLRLLHEPSAGPRRKTKRKKTEK